MTAQPTDIHSEREEDEDLNALGQRLGGDAVRERLDNARPIPDRILEKAARKAAAREDINAVEQRLGGEAVRQELDEARPFDERMAEKAKPPAGFKLDDGKPLLPLPVLVRDLYPRNGTGSLIGQSGAAKTFVALHAGICIASGQPFFGKKIVERVGCVHLAYENGGTIEHRVRAARLHADLDTNLPFLYIAQAGDLFNEEHRNEIVKRLKDCHKFFIRRFNVRLGLVTIDTLSKAFVLQDENSSTEVVKIWKRLEAVAVEIDAFVQGVHHLGKDPRAGARGSSAHRDNTDFSIFALAERDPLAGTVRDHRLVVEKNRDGAEGPLGGFDVVDVEIGQNAGGEPFYSCGITPNGTATAKRGSGKPAAPYIVTFRQAFDEARHTCGRPHQVLKGGDVASPTVTAVPVEAVRTEFYRRWATGEAEVKKAQDARRQAFHRGLKGLSTEYGREVIVRTGEEVLWQL